MIDYGRIKSSNRPNEIEVTSTSVFVSSNIQEYSEEIDGQTSTGFEYNYIQYDKDEYLIDVAIKNSQTIKELNEELAAAKILLGVE